MGKPNKSIKDIVSLISLAESLDIPRDELTIIRESKSSDDGFNVIFWQKEGVDLRIKFNDIINKLLSLGFEKNYPAGLQSDLFKYLEDIGSEVLYFDYYKFISGLMYYSDGRYYQLEVLTKQIICEDFSKNKTLIQFYL
jgi:hypothetical protein